MTFLMYLFNWWIENDFRAYFLREMLFRNEQLHKKESLTMFSEIGIA